MLASMDRNRRDSEASSGKGKDHLENRSITLSDTKTEHSQSSGQYSTTPWYSVIRLRQRFKAKKWFLFAFTLSAIGLPLLYLNVPLHFDEGIYLTIGEQIAAGETLYADFADHKPPGIFYLAAVIYELFGPPVRYHRDVSRSCSAGNSGSLFSNPGPPREWGLLLTETRRCTQP